MFESIVLGIVQGIFEWLPISSQGNLVLLMVGVFKIGAIQALKYSIFLHIGTLLAVIVYFYKDIVRIIKQWKKEKELISFLIVSTIITGIIGYPLLKLITNFSFRGELLLGLIGLSLIFTGLFQKTAHKQRKYEKRKLTIKHSIILGIVQGLAVIPGISRSGITVSVFLLKKYNPRQALYLSFLMSIPIIFIGSIFLPIIDGFPKLPVGNLIAGLVFSFIFGLITIRILLKLAQKIKFWLFCVIIGFLAFLPLLVALV